LKIFGYDIDPNRVRDCQVNARKAGVEEDIVFECKDIKDLRVAPREGVIISNPPYGVKLSSTRDLAPVYGALSKIFRERPGWSFYLLTADKKFPEYFKSARPDKVRKLYNGTLEVNYYQYYGKKEV
jgi:putative N6-adenine-specific DNA methylase